MNNFYPMNNCNQNYNMNQQQMNQMMNMMMGNNPYGNNNPYYNNNIIEFIFVKKPYKDIKVQAFKNELFSNVIKKYQLSAGDTNENEYTYNNQTLDPNATVGSFNFTSNVITIQVMNKSLSVLSSINSGLSFFNYNQISLFFQENGNNIQINVENNVIFLNAMNDYETKTNSRGQNDYYINERKIDINKKLDENGIYNGSIILVKKKYNLNNNNLKLWFKKENIQEILIQAKYDELVQKQVDSYLAKLQYLLGNGQPLNNKYNYLYMGRKLNLNQTVSESGLKDDSRIFVQENKTIINVKISMDFQVTNILASLDETVGELISRYKQKRGLNENDRYMFIFNARVLNDYLMTLRQVGITNESLINVAPPGIIGAK